MTRRITALLLLGAVGLVGCFETRAPLSYIGDEPLKYYVGQATHVDHPACVENCPNEAVVASDSPRTLRDRSYDEVWEMPLAQAVHIALENATVIRSNATFGNAPLLSNGNLASTVHDPAIQQSNVVGNTGVEAALSAFDTDFTTSMVWGRDERVQNSPFSPAGFGVILPTVATETGAFNTGLNKRIANGGALSVTHTMNYNGVPPGLFPFPSSYAGNVTVGYRQPLWAGGGVDYTRIAGPINASTAFTQNTLGQGVLIARINENVSLDDFEANVRDLVLDVENLYWDLYLQYRLYNAAVLAREGALDQWRRLQKTIEIGGGDQLTVVNEALARDQYFAARAAAEQTLAGVYSTEVRLRRLLGLPVNDGKVIRPADEPLTAEYFVDWHAALSEAMCERLELRRQKWNVKRLELQLCAAHKLVNPRLDFVSSYNVNAFGDQLIGLGSDDDAVGSPQGLRYAYESLTQGNQTGWTLGFEFSMPIGFRHANTQVRNVELQLVKARDVLAAQELDISHELATAFQSVAQHYQTAKTNFNRRRAARDRLDRFLSVDRVGGFSEQGAGSGINVKDEILRAQTSLAQAERDYFTSLVEYNKSIAGLQYRKGTLLEFNRVFLTEGAWDPRAYALADRRAKARSHAFAADRLLHAEPGVIAMPEPVGRVEFLPHEMPVDGELIPVPDGVEMRGGAPFDVHAPTPDAVPDAGPGPVDGARPEVNPGNATPDANPPATPQPPSGVPAPMPALPPRGNVDPTAGTSRLRTPGLEPLFRDRATIEQMSAVAPTNPRKPVLRAPGAASEPETTPVRSAVYETEDSRTTLEPIREIRVDRAGTGPASSIWEDTPRPSTTQAPIERRAAEQRPFDFGPLWK